MDDAEGDRRALLRRHRRGRQDPSGARPARPRSTARTSRESRPATQVRPRPPARTTRRRRDCPVSRRGRRSATTGSSTSRRRSVTWATRRRSSPRSRRRSRDGMDVINFSGGGPQTDPASDAIIEAVRNVAAAGVVPVISAGNDRDDYGLGSAGSPGTAPTRSRSPRSPTPTSSRPALTRHRARSCRPADPRPVRPHRRRRRRPGRTPTSSSSTSARSWARTAPPSPRDLCGPPGNLERRHIPLPAGSLNGRDRARLARVCTFALKAARVRAAGAIGIVLVDNRPGEAERHPGPARRPGRDDLRLRRLRPALAISASRGRTHAIRIGRDRRSSTPAAAASSRASPPAGLTAFGHLLKPDLGAPGGQILSSTLAIVGGPVRRLRRDEHGCAARRRRRRAAAPAPPGWTPPQVKSALVSTAATAWADTARTIEAPVLTAGAGLTNVITANDPKLFTDPVSLSYSRPERDPRPCSKSLLLAFADAGDGAGTWTVEVKPQSQPSGVEIIVPGTITIAPGGDTQLPGHSTCRRERRPRRGVRLPAAAPRRHRPEGRVRDARHAARARAGPDPATAAVPDGRHAQGRLARSSTAIRLRPSARRRATSARR